eukprot:Hpha_TRINITY_DN12805_c0_g1::TRINITY_DN12805_c0_g1_i1::g.24338::m.24338
MEPSPRDGDGSSKEWLVPGRAGAVRFSVLSPSGNTPRSRLYSSLCPVLLPDGSCRVVLYGGWEHTTEGPHTPPDSCLVLQCAQADSAYVLDWGDRAWTKLPTTGDVPRGMAQHSAVMHPTAPGKMVLYGGCDDDGDRQHTAYELALPEGRWEAQKATVEPGPIALPCHSSHTAVPDEEQGLVYVFGGGDGMRSFSDLWCLDAEGRRWSLVQPQRTPPHLEPFNGDSLAASLSEKSDVTCSESDTETDEVDCHAASPATPRLLLRPAPAEGEVRCPPRRLYHCSCLARRRLYIFGGAPDMKTTTADDAVHDDLWYFDLNHKCWVEVLYASGVRPEARGSAGCVFIDPFIYIYGGFDGSRKYGDLYRFDVDIQHWERIQPPAELVPRWGHACCRLSDHNGGGFAVFGGFNNVTRQLHDEALFIKPEAPSLKYLVAKVVVLNGIVPAPRRRLKGHRSVVPMPERQKQERDETAP